MSAKKYDFPPEPRYADSDEWLRPVEDGCVRLGITDYAQSELQDIVFVELPEVGTVLEAGQACGVVESVKAVSDLYAPIAGEVVATNGALEDAPELLNEDPYGEGWILALRPASAADLDGLMSADGYRAYVEARSA